MFNWKLQIFFMNYLGKASLYESMKLADPNFDTKK